MSQQPPQLSPDGRFYWDGQQWRPAPDAPQLPALPSGDPHNPSNPYYWGSHANQLPRVASGTSNVRAFWYIWCGFWAAFWLLFGFFSFGLAWLLVPFSLLAILLPVGRERPLP